MLESTFSKVDSRVCVLLLMDCRALRCKARNDRENNAYTSTARNDRKRAEKVESTFEKRKWILGKTLKNVKKWILGFVFCCLWIATPISSARNDGKGFNVKMDCHALRCKARNDRENNAYTSTARNDGKRAEQVESTFEKTQMDSRENAKKCKKVDSRVCVLLLMDCHADFQSARNDRKRAEKVESTFEKTQMDCRALRCKARNDRKVRASTAQQRVGKKLEFLGIDIFDDFFCDVADFLRDVVCMAGDGGVLLGRSLDLSDRLIDLR